MIQAQELRINNLLKRADDSVFSVGANDIKIISEWNNPFAPLPEPIPLTEEWLVKFGFIADNYGVFYKTKDCSNNSNSIIDLWAKKCLVEQFDISIGQEFGDTHNLCFIKYVHQLQNIYFALTGEELTEKKVNP